jgi:hypothetical protein
MKVKANEFLKLIKKASVEGLIDEVVLSDDMKFSVTDDASSVLSIVKKSMGESGFGEIGLFELDKLIKAVNFASGSIFDAEEELNILVDKNHLVFKKDDNEFRFHLSDPKAITRCVDNSGAVLEKIRTVQGVKIGLERRDVDSVLKAISLLEPDIVSIVTKEGKVFCVVGVSKDHNTSIKLGSYEKGEDMVLQFSATSLAKVLTTISMCDIVDMEIRQATPLVLNSEDHYLLLAPLK